MAARTLPNPKPAATMQVVVPQELPHSDPVVMEISGLPSPFAMKKLNHRKVKRQTLWLMPKIKWHSLHPKKNDEPKEEPSPSDDMAHKGEGKVRHFHCLEYRNCNITDEQIAPKTQHTSPVATPRPYAAGNLQQNQG